MVNVKYNVDIKEISKLLADINTSNVCYDERTDGKDAKTFFASTFPHFNFSNQINFIKERIHSRNTPKKFESDNQKYPRGILFEFIDNRFKHDGKLWSLYLKILVSSEMENKVIISLHMS